MGGGEELYEEEIETFTMAVSEGSQIGLLVQYSGIIFFMLSLNFSHPFAGMLYLQRYKKNFKALKI